LLRLDPVDVALLVDDDPLQEVPCGVIADLEAKGDAGTQDGERPVLQREVVIELLTGSRTHIWS
jgi:hypothetical protein